MFCFWCKRDMQELWQHVDALKTKVESVNVAIARGEEKDKQILENQNKLYKLFKDHTREEMEKYSIIETAVVSLVGTKNRGRGVLMALGALVTIVSLIVAIVAVVYKG